MRFSLAPNTIIMCLHLKQWTNNLLDISLVHHRLTKRLMSRYVCIHLYIPYVTQSDMFISQVYSYQCLACLVSLNFSHISYVQSPLLFFRFTNNIIHWYLQRLFYFILYCYLSFYILFILFLLSSNFLDITPTS